MTPPSVALLTFNRNDPVRTIELVRRLSDYVTEAVVVDSSDPAAWKLLEGGLSPPTHRAVRAIPTGYADLLQPVGVDEATAEWVFYCDPDEEPSPELLRRVAHPEGADAYIVPRWERTLSAFTPHLRLYRRGAFMAPDPAYAFPGIRGTVRKLPRSECLIHHRDYRAALAEDYRSRVMDLESFERPVDGVWFRAVLGPAVRLSRVGSPPDAGVSPRTSIPESAAALGTLVVAARELFRTGSPAAAAFQWKYHRARAQFQAGLPEEERRRRAAITRATRAGGGLIHFLGFDRPVYVRTLTSSFTWDLDGPAVLHRLIDYRFQHGHPMPSWQPSTSFGSAPSSSSEIRGERSGARESSL
jgi:hypothetical protein